MKKFFKFGCLGIVGVFLVVIIALIVDFSNDDEQASKNLEESAENIKKDNEKVENEEIDQEAFKSLTSVITGSSFIKEAKAEGQNADIIFYEDYQQYKEANPESKVSEEDYKSYFQTGDGVEKVLFEATSYLFEKLPEMNQLSVVLPFEGKTYRYEVKRDDIKEFIGADGTDEERKAFMKSHVSS